MPNTHIAKQPQNCPSPPLLPQSGAAVPLPGQNKILTQFEIIVFQYLNTPADNLITRNWSHGKIIETDRLKMERGTTGLGPSPSGHPSDDGSIAIPINPVQM